MTSITVYANQIKSLKYVDPDEPVYIKISTNQNMHTYKCSKCPQPSHRSFNMVRHYERLHVPTKEILSCVSCNTKFNTKWEQQNHACKYNNSPRNSFKKKEKNNFNLLSSSRPMREKPIRSSHNFLKSEEKENLNSLSSLRLTQENFIGCPQNKKRKLQKINIRSTAISVSEVLSNSLQHKKKKPPNREVQMSNLDILVKAVEFVEGANFKHLSTM